tara:strand:- start:43 stop:924 length:882 start_codon:yes stop_codon:yes gene_type:complete
MNKEISLEQIFFDVVMFFDRNKKLIISITLVAIIGVFLFQKLKPSFYATTAIATSGISEYQDIEFDINEDVRNQRMAINLINDLQLDVEKEDYQSLKDKLRLSSIDQASQIKFIEAELLLRQDKDEKFNNTSDFQINLLVRDADIIPIIQKGLIDYFEFNPYVDTLFKRFLESCDHIIFSTESRIDYLEDRDLLIIKKPTISSLDVSQLSISNIKGGERSNKDQIIYLRNYIEEIKTLKLLKPLNYPKEFTKTTVAEREVLVWGSVIGFLSFILSILIAIIREVKQKALKETK